MNPSNQEIVFFSELLKERFPQSWEKIKEILVRNHIGYGFLNGTKDIWARDYMPVDVGDGKFIQFQYNSSYITDEKYKDQKTIPEEIPERSQFKPISSDIILDGGNVIRLNDKILISERVLKDNPNIKANELVNRLSELLNGNVYLVTDINSDMTGHVDGMARFLNDTTILVNDREVEYFYWGDGLQKTLVNRGFDLIDVPCFTHKQRKYPLSAIGGFLNYLELDNIIILPVFASNDLSKATDGTNVREMDQDIINQFKKWFPDKTIEPVEINDVVRHGGLMNCISWHTHLPVPMYQDKQIIPVYKEGDRIMVVSNTHYAEGIEKDNSMAVVVDLRRSTISPPNSGQNFLRFSPMEAICAGERMMYIQEINEALSEEQMEEVCLNLQLC